MHGNEWKVQAAFPGFTAMFAASGFTNTLDEPSSTAVTLFLAFCALIVVGQLVPLVRMKRIHRQTGEKVRTPQEEGAEPRQ